MVEIEKDKWTGVERKQSGGKRPRVSEGTMFLPFSIWEGDVMEQLACGCLILPHTSTHSAIVFHPGHRERHASPFRQTFTSTKQMHTCTHAHTRTHTHTQTHTHTHTHAYTHMQTRTHTYTQMCTHKHLHTHRCAHTYTHAHAHRHTHTHCVITVSQ